MWSAIGCMLFLLVIAGYVAFGKKPELPENDKQDKDPS